MIDHSLYIAEKLGTSNIKETISSLIIHTVSSF